MKLSPEVKKQLARIVGAENVQTDDVALALFAYDCSVSRTRPDGVIFIRETAQIAPVLKVLSHYKIPFVPRASATNHAGSCAALKGGVILNLTGLNQLIEINTRAGFAVVEPGVITGDLQAALAPLGFFYAPDPASERVCTVGGNLAQNASGARCMKYGGTVDHILAVKAVLADGTEVSLSRQEAGPDWVGLLAGSEGTLGVITQLTVRILPVAKHIHTFLVTFPSLADSVQTVSDLVAHGIIPRCVEAMDQLTARSVEDFSHAGYPMDAAALLIIELDGTPSQIKKDEAVLEQICQCHHAQTFIPAKTEAERTQLWRGRRSAYAALARLAPNVMVGDGTVPRSELPRALEKVQRILSESDVRASLLFHAGDGNFHPHLLFDERNKLETGFVSRVLKQVLQACIEVGGTLSGEHGVGVEKRAVMAWQYDAPTLQLMQRIKHALDPQQLANPLKILPHRFAEKARLAGPVCAEIRTLQTQLETYRASKLAYQWGGAQSQFKTRAKNFISTRSLQKIVEIDTANYTVTAEAGVLLTDLAQALQQAGVCSVLPAGKGTLGGAFCSGQFPGFYSHVLGVEALLPDGSFIRYGGKVMKNAAGYPLTRLFAGSQGMFGLVTRLTFKIFATPQPILKPCPFIPASASELSVRLSRVLNPDGLLNNVPGGQNG